MKQTLVFVSLSCLSTILKWAREDQLLRISSSMLVIQSKNTNRRWDDLWRMRYNFATLLIMVPDDYAGEEEETTTTTMLLTFGWLLWWTTTICVEQDVFMLDANEWQLVLFADVVSRASGRWQHLRRVQSVNGSAIWFAINEMQVLVPMSISINTFLLFIFLK